MATASSKDQVLPHNLDAERAVLGAVLVSPELWPVASSRLRRDDFYRKAHGLVFEAMESLGRRSVPADPVTLREELQRMGAIDEVGGSAYLSSLVDGVPRGMNVEHYAAIIKNKAGLRKVASVAEDITEMSYAADEDVAVVVDAALRRLFDVAEAPAGGLKPAHQAVSEYATALSEGTLGEPVATGFADLDPVLGGGFRPGDLVVVAARPSVGKSALAVNTAEAMAAAGVRTIFFSLEMSERALAARMLASRCGVPAHKLERGEATAIEYEYAGNAVFQISQDAAPLLLETSSRTVTQVEAWCRRAKQEIGGLQCAFVDYLQLLLPEVKTASGEQEIAAISRGLKRVAKDQGIVLVALSQLSRAPEDRRDKRPTLADLRGSGAIEQDCDVALLLYREEMHHPAKAEAQGIAEVIVAKQRNGPTGVVRLQYQKELTLFRDLAH